MKTLTASLPPLAVSGNDCEPSTSLHLAEYATRRAELLFGCYRKGDANDPDTYVAGIAAVLADYPEAVIHSVTDPRTGLASTLQWLPTVAEVKSACEDRIAPLRREREREARRQEMQRLIEAPPVSRYDEARLAAKAKAWLDRTDPKAQQLAPAVKQFPGIPVDQLKAMAGAEWDKIPDAKDYDFNKLDGKRE